MELNYFDERYYLYKTDDNSANVRKFLKYWKEKEEGYRIDEIDSNKELIDLYKKYIKKVSKLINEISLDNSISKISLLSTLLQAGAFSWDKYVFSNENDILLSNLGLNIITSKGCCRNIASFINDVLNESNEETRIMPVYSTNIKSKTNAYKNKANHVVNLIKYDNNLYAYDPSYYIGGTLYYFTNELEMTSYDNKKQFLYYKPYLDYVFFNLDFKDIITFLNSINNNTSLISFDEYIDITSITGRNLESNISLVKDFMKITRKDVYDIKEKILKK